VHIPPFKQAVFEQGFIRILQSDPVYPNGQAHTYPLSNFVQIPPFLQGDELQ
jgi:hypothetical protein